MASVVKLLSEDLDVLDAPQDQSGEDTDDQSDESDNEDDWKGPLLSHPGITHSDHVFAAVVLLF